MQYLDSIIIHNFKSFKHANIRFSNGFNCIVGANGSGKSNLCDALLFALGESSLKRMRVSNTSLLINSFAKPKSDDGVKRAYVKIAFGGDNPLEVARIIKSNNKMGYRLNGKHATRQEVIEALRSYRSEINDTNIIAQGEVSSMMSLNAKERRELIDVAAGIKEFNDKKEVSMRELQKVEEKANDARIVLNERKGFLDQLEKEKEDAEKYMQLTDTVRRISYTILKNSEHQAESDFNAAAKALAEAEEKKKESNLRINELSLMLEKLSGEKEALVKSLNERSVELSSTNKMLENINRELAVKETESKSLKERISDTDAQLTQSKKELKKLQGENAEGSASIESLKKQLEGKAELLSSKEVYEDDAGKSSINIIGRNQKRIDELYQKEEELSKQFLQNRFARDDIDKSIKAAKEQIGSKSAESERLLSEVKAQKEKLSVLNERIALLGKEADAAASDVQKQQKAIDANYEERVNLRERIAVSGGGSDKVNETLKRNVENGFYGRAYELCSYESKFELAINAAATSRLGYLVVESAEVADTSIKILKAKQLGRASFIPLKDLTTSYKEQNKGLDKLIDHVRFDKKFESAFNYIFANTYVVKSIDEAKSIGFGKGRFVTLDGDLVENSGIISGGSSKGLQSPALLESRLKALEQQAKEVASQLGGLNSELERRRKEIASNQTEGFSCTVTIKHLEELSSALSKELEGGKARVSDLESRMLQATAAGTKLESQRDTILTELNSLKGENEKIYAATGADVEKKGKPEKGEMSKLKSLREEVQQLKIKLAELSKEEEMRNARISEIEATIGSRHEDGAETRKRLALFDGEMIELSKRKAELQQKVGKSDANSQELYKRIQDFDARIAKLANDRGRCQSELDRTGRDSIENETRKVQIQTRINDIKAELLSYQNVQALEELAMGELEAKRAIAKNEIEKLGAVNLKAPEVYGAKKREVEEAKSKLAVLSNERDSIIAMINEIESKKLNIFNETLSDVNAHFKKLYSYVFEGSAQMQLDNPKDPFNSGLSLMINSPKNRNSNVEALSGGEKTLVMTMMIFAIQAHSPMSFYIFDEIDFSLDKENSKKLSRLMKEMSKSSQIIVISHNDSLITATDAAIGIVHRNGESKAVGLQLTPTESVARAT